MEVRIEWSAFYGGARTGNGTPLMVLSYDFGVLVS